MHTCMYIQTVLFRKKQMIYLIFATLHMHMTDISLAPSGGLSSPSLPLEDVQGAEEEYVFLLMECLRATIEGTI